MPSASCRLNLWARQEALSCYEWLSRRRWLCLALRGETSAGRSATGTHLENDAVNVRFAYSTTLMRKKRCVALVVALVVARVVPEAVLVTSGVQVMGGFKLPV